MTESPAPDLTAEERTFPDDAEGHSSRWFWRALKSLLILLVFLIACLTGLWLFRLPILQSVAPSLLQTVLGTAVQLDIATLDLNVIEVRDIEVDGGPRLDRLTLTLEKDWTTGVFVEEALVEGLNLHLVLQPDGSTTIRGLETLFSSETETQAGDPTSLPLRTLLIRDLTLLAETPLGPQTVTGFLGASIGNAPSLSHIEIEVSLESPGSNSALIGTAALSGEQISANGVVDLSLAHWLPFVPEVERAQGSLTVSFEAQSALSVDPESHAGAGELAWSGVSITPTGLAPLHLEDALVQAAFKDGNLALSLPEPLEIYLDALPPAVFQALPADLLPYASGVPSLTLSALSDEPAIQVFGTPQDGWTMDFQAEVSGATGPISLVLHPSRLALTPSFTPVGLILKKSEVSLLRGLDLPRDVAGTLEIGLLDLDLTAMIDTGSIPAMDIPYRLDAAIYGPIAGEVWAERAGMELEGVLHLRDLASGLDMTVEPGGTFLLSGLTGTGDLRLSPRIRMDVAGRDPMKLGVDFNDPVASLTATGGFRLGAFSLALPGEETPVSLNFGRQPIYLRHRRGGTSLSIGPVDIEEPTQAIGITGITVQADHANGTGTISVRADGLTAQGHPFLPGAMTGTFAFATGPTGITKIDGPVTLAGGQIQANSAVTLDPNASRPVTEVSIESEPLKFGPFDLTLSDFLPGGTLPGQENESSVPLPDLDGVLRLSTTIRQDEGGPSGHFDVDLSDFTLSLKEGALRNLNSRLSVDLANLPETNGVQSLSADIFVPGLPQIPLSAEFDVDRSARVTFKDLSIDLFDGSLSLVDTVVDPETSVLEGTVRLRRLDIQKALSLIEVDGVDATGLISGLLPVHVSNGEEEIRNGAVAAEGGGVIRIDNPTVDQALSTDTSSVQGTAVNLVADILRNFQYESLSGEVNLPRTGDGRLLLKLAGSNPDVFDGHPVEFNINLESDFRKLFELLGRLVTLTETILGGSVEDFQ